MFLARAADSMHEEANIIWLSLSFLVFLCFDVAAIVICFALTLAKIRKRVERWCETKYFFVIA
jgi:hypothetical protein